MKRSNSKSLELAIFDPNQGESNIWHPFPGSLLRALGRLCRDGRQHRGLGPKLVARAGLSDGHSVHDSTWTSRAHTVAGQLLHSCGARVLVRLWLVPSRLGNDKYTWDNCNMPRRSDLRWTCVSWQKMAWKRRSGEMYRFCGKSDLFVVLGWKPFSKQRLSPSRC